MELIGDLLPAGVVNVVNGFGLEAGKPLASSSRIAKVAFTGETTTGHLIMCYPLGEFLVGDQDVLLGEIGGCPFYMNTSTGSTPN